MASETYYYCFSLLLVLAFGFNIANMVFFRAKGKTLLNQKYKLNTKEYNNLKKFSSNHGIAIGILLFILSIINLIYNIIRLLDLDYPAARSLLYWAPIAIAALFFGLMRFAYIHGIYGPVNKDKGSKPR